MKCYVHPDVEAVGVCTSCGKSVCSVCAMDVAGKVVCKLCAEKSVAAPSAVNAAPSGKKDPVLSMIASLIIPGIGQLINGQTKKGVILFIGDVVAWAGSAFLYLILGSILTFIFALLVGIVTFGMGAVCGLLGYCCAFLIFVIPVIIHVYAAYDAYKTSKQINVGEPVSDWLP